MTLPLARPLRNPVIGWDIGGANLKMTMVINGQVQLSHEEACPLWLGLDQLDRAFAAALARVPKTDLEHPPIRLNQPDREAAAQAFDSGAISDRPDVTIRGTSALAPQHIITMTGELADLFEGRHAGVIGLAEAARRHLGDELIVSAGRAGFVPLSEVPQHTSNIASANWYATATWIGTQCPEALLVDIGSTTADIIPIGEGRPRTRGYLDAERLISGELVYLGTTRTALMALADEVPFRGARTRVMAEYFATIADVFSVLGRLPDEVQHYATADNRGSDLASCQIRLARQIGCDAADLSSHEIMQLGQAFAEAHLRRLHDGAAQVLSGAGLKPDAPLIACGIGAFLLGDLGQRLGRPVLPLKRFFPAVSDAQAGRAADFAPSASLALLAALDTGGALIQVGP